MTNNINFKLEIDNDSVLIKVNEKEKKKLSLKNKTISTKEIYEMLDYNKDNKYKLDCQKIPEDEVSGQEVKRLYNYLYDLLSLIVDGVNEENQKHMIKDDLL